MDKKIIIFTDLDGSLLDSSYSFKKALPALRLIKKKNIPLLICSSKTKSEIEHYRKKLRNAHP
ncbi:MAG: HAD hydrolase family protein, partial [Candidatus Mariimomonas ferrooxydans]